MYKQLALAFLCVLVMAATGCQLTEENTSSSDATIDVANNIASAYCVNGSDTTQAPAPTMDFKYILHVIFGGILTGDKGGFGNNHCEHHAQIGPMKTSDDTDTATGPTATITYTCYDATGAEQTAFDKETTAEIKWSATITDTRTITNDESTITKTFTRTSELDITGLLTDTITINGSGSSQESSSVTDTETSVTKTVDKSSSYTISNVTFAKVPLTNPYPTGIITYTITIAKSDGTDTTTETYNVTITFDGDSTAELQVNDDVFTLDLTKGHAKRR